MLDMVLNAMVLIAPLGSFEIKGRYIILWQIENTPKFLHYSFAIDIDCNIFAEFCEKSIMVKTHCILTLLRRIPLWCSFSN